MSVATTFAELDGQHVELLPARTVFSLLSLVDPGAPGNPTGPDKPCPHDKLGNPLPGEANLGDGSTALDLAIAVGSGAAR